MGSLLSAGRCSAHPTDLARSRRIHEAAGRVGLMQAIVPRRAPLPGSGFDVYWQFAAERQRVYRNRLDGHTGPALTTDPVISSYRFTNAYRASDRVSQYLISNVIYDTPREWADTFVRVLVFKLFNRIDTWEHLQANVGEIGATALLTESLDDALGQE